MRVDTQSHLLPPWFFEELKQRKRSPVATENESGRFLDIGRWRRKVNPKATSLLGKLADMDAAGVDVTILSPEQPGPELFGHGGAALARRLNDWTAGVCREHPDRFAGLAVLPLQDADASVAELRRCRRDLDFRGVLLYANVAGRPLDRAGLGKLFEAAAETGTLLYLHPAYPIVADATADYDLIPGVGFMVDTAICAIRLIMSGLLEDLPQLTFVLPHTGGALPYLIGRIDDQVQRLGRGGEKLKDSPGTYLKKMYTDTVAPHPRNLAFALDFWGPDKILFATDHPFTNIQPYVDLVENAAISREDKDKIFGGNAKKLFRL